MPRYQARPLRLLAECEYHLRVLYARRKLVSQRALHPPPIADLMASRYAAADEKLIRSVKAHRIRLVLATYSMAVK